LVNIGILMVSFDVLLYVAHYSLHVLFWQYHRDHHQTRATSPSSGWYMHIVDLMMELWIPIFMPAFFFNMGWLTISTWLVLVEWDGVHTHSGFDFWPGVIPGPKRHWLHHMLFYCNYSLGLGDYAFGTEAPKLAEDTYVQIFDEPPSIIPKGTSSRRLEMPSFSFAPSIRDFVSRRVTFQSDEMERAQFHAGLEDIGLLSMGNLEATFGQVIEPEPLLPSNRLRWVTKRSVSGTNHGTML